MTGSTQSSHAPKSKSDAQDQSDHTADAADLNADALIRSVMIAQKRDANQDILPELEPAPEVQEEQPIKHPRRRFGLRRAQKTEPSASLDTPPTADASKPRAKSSVLSRMRKVGTFRPSPKLMFCVAVAAIVFIRPWLIPITLFLTFLIVLITYLSLGPDRVAELVVSFWRRLQARKPEFAEDLRARAERMAVRIDAVLDRLPDKWTSGIYLPDFSRPTETPDDLPDPFERLAREARREGV